MSRVLTSQSQKAEAKTSLRAPRSATGRTSVLLQKSTAKSSSKVEMPVTGAGVKPKRAVAQKSNSLSTSVWSSSVSVNSTTSAKSLEEHPHEYRALAWGVLGVFVLVVGFYAYSQYRANRTDFLPETVLTEAQKQEFLTSIESSSQVSVPVITPEMKADFLDSLSNQQQ